MDRIHCICLSFFFLISVQAFSQADRIDSTGQVPGDSSTYFTDLSYLLNINVFMLIKSNSVTVHLGKNQLELKPNSPVSLGLGFNYKGIGLGLGVGLPHTNQRIAKFGKTSRFDMRINVYTRWLSGGAYYQFYRGYYNANPGDFTEWDKDYYPTIPDMKTLSTGLYAYYIFNHKKFSTRAVFSRTQVQRRSAGSLALGTYFYYDEVNSPQGLIPAEFSDSLATDLDILSYKYFSVGIMFGYMYTWVFAKRFFLHGSIIPGVGYKNVRMNFTREGGGAEHKPDGQLLLNIAFGCELNRVYLGFAASTLVHGVKYKEYEMDLSTDSFRFYVGKRFDLSNIRMHKRQ